MRPTTIITLLTADHKEVANMFAILEKTTSRAARKRREIFTKLDTALSAHAEFEEAQVYPLLEAAKQHRPLALEALEEHDQLKRLLVELRELDAADERWMAKLTVLMEDVRHHVKEEEGDLFTKLRSLVDTEELVRLGQAYEETKAELSVA